VSKVQNIHKHKQQREKNSTTH